MHTHSVLIFVEYDICKSRNYLNLFITTNCYKVNLDIKQREFNDHKLGFVFLIVGGGEKGSGLNYQFREQCRKEITSIFDYPWVQYCVVNVEFIKISNCFKG